MSSKYVYWMPCGKHRRTRKNQTEQGHCLPCHVEHNERIRQRSPRGHAGQPYKWRNCDHPRTPENTVTKSDGYTQCRTCKEDRQRSYERGPRAGRRSSYKGGKATIRLVTFPPLPLPSDLAPPIDTGRSYGLAPRRTA